MRIGELAALGAALCWTINGMFLESAGRRMGLGPVNFIRLIFGIIFLSIYMYISRGRLLPTDANMNAWLYLSISGIIGFFIGDYFLIKSMLTIGPRMSMLMMSLSPPMAALIDFIIFRTVLTGIQIIGMIITLLGVSIVVMGRKKPEDKALEVDIKSGVIYGALGALGQAGGLIFSKLGMGTYNPFAATQIRIIAAIVVFLVIMVATNDYTKITEGIRHARELWKVVMAGLTGPFVGVGLSLLALQYTEAGVASTLSSVMPVTILPFSVIIYKEKIGLIEILGTILSVVGIAILFIL
ncbi:DMT family transporter [Microaceticoccus formicicus]|uniref:DMT family transporter n=1 Tax=Microaceticoccus formicicus TaxID=3118105 RepID=UPI003CD043D0|nr:DMT family transporter [Peptoniphilaceae bacterium AMB_02]